MINGKRLAITMISIAVIFYTAGYFKGQESIIKNYGESLTKEATVYLAARDIGKRMFGH